MGCPSSSARGGQQIGAEYIEALKRYLQALRQEGKGLPARNGKVFSSAVALASGVDRQSLYKNPRCRELLELAAQELGLSGIESRDVGTSAKDNWKDQRIMTLEQQVAALQAEVQGLRRQLQKLAHIEQHLIETGRRVIP